MDESASVRTIIIGVSLLLAIATISAILIYYNTARQMASRAARGSDLASNYEENIKDILVSGSYNVAGDNHITGNDVKNLLSYFYKDDSVVIDINNVVYIDSYDAYMPKTVVNYDRMQNANNSSESYTWLMKNILSNQKFNINRNDKFDLGNGNNGMKLEIIGIVE